MRHLILISTFLILPGLSLESRAASCRDGRWSDVSGSIMMALRSNSCHYWAWAADKNAERLVPAEWLKIQLMVTGDPHHENFSHFSFGKKRIYLPNDLDDTGKAPAVLELFKFIGVSRSVQEDEDALSTRELVEAYMEGLKGHKYSGDFPDWLETDRDVTKAQMRQDEENDLDKQVKDDQFKSKDSLTPEREMTTVEKREFDRLEQQAFARELPSGWKVLDRGIHTKGGDRGGSQDLDRFWYLLSDENGDRHIWEFKELRQPAVWLYQRQKGTDASRLRHALEIYWGEKLPFGFGVVEAGNRVFWMRPKLPHYTDFEVADFREHKKKFAELSYFIAYKLGYWHGQQLDKSDIKELNDVDQMTDIAKEFVKSYLKDVRKERGN